MIRKYGNKKVTLDGIEFDSAKEARRYSELKLLERAGEISDLELQKEYELIPNQRGADGKIIERAVKYKADFVYKERGETVVEDVKGYRATNSVPYAKFVIKRKLMLYVHGIRIKEI